MEKIVSPGVFTNEKDLSYLPSGVSAIGASIIGPTEKGPAFVPIQVTSQNEFTTKFGSGTYYTPYTVQNYLKSAGIVTIVRVLGVDSYTRRFFEIKTTSDGPGAYASKIMAVVSPTGSDSNVTGISIESGGVLNDFIIHITESSATSSYSASFDSRATNYITDVLTGAVPAEVIYNFPTAQSASVSMASTGSIEGGTYQTAASMSSDGYTWASTPWVMSQNVGVNPESGSTSYYQLFKFHSLSDGVASGTEVKVGIFAVKPEDEVTNSDYGEFSVVVRKYGDTDARQEVLETFNNASLNPASINYLPRLIGDRKSYYRTIGGESKLVYEGDWPNMSSYVRVEMSEVAAPKNAVPMGVNSYTVPTYNGGTAYPSMSFVTTQTINGETNTRAYRGISTTDVDTKAFLGETAGQAGSTYASSTGSNTAFHLDNYVFTYTANGVTWSEINTRKFIMPLQGGSDGLDPRIGVAKGEGISATNTQRFDCSSSGTAGSRAYKKAIDAIGNPDDVDLNLLVLPGILKRLHSYVSNYAINICEERGDCFYIMDTAALTDSIATTVSEITTLDSSYAATYYPWVKIVDPNTNQPLWAPPSVVMAGIYSFNDKVAQEWFAPAGLNRGGITEAAEAYTRLTHTERDTLYNARINPIASFPGQGVVAWGQKTIQAKASALDRVNVRRLIIALKKYIASSTRYLVFEQNSTATRNRFLNIVNPYLESVQNRAGLYAFKVVMDDTNNTPDVIDRNQLYGEIYLQPTKTAEMIILDFNILPTGAVFPE